MTDISIFKDLASVSQPSHHRVTSDLDTFEVAQSRALSTADVGVVHFRYHIQQETEHPQPLAASLRAMPNIPLATVSKRA
jgi:hypothetical protein